MLVKYDNLNSAMDYDERAYAAGPFRTIYDCEKAIVVHLPAGAYRIAHESGLFFVLKTDYQIKDKKRKALAFFSGEADSHHYAQQYAQFKRCLAAYDMVTKAETEHELHAIHCWESGTDEKLVNNCNRYIRYIADCFTSESSK